MILVIADRDGTLNHNNRSKLNGPYYVLHPEQFEWMPDAKEGMAELLNKEILVGVVTSQNCISEGLISKEEVELIHAKMNNDLFELCGKRVPVEVIYGVKEAELARATAKAEAIKVIVKGYTEQGLDIERVYVIGDTQGDILAGILFKDMPDSALKRGCYTMHVELDYTSEKDRYVQKADYHVKSFKEAVDIILLIEGY